MLRINRNKIDTQQVTCSAVSMQGVLCCVCSVLGHLTPVHQCVRSVCCAQGAVSHETHRWGYFLRTKLSNKDYFFERRKVLNCSNAFGVAVLLQTLR